MYKEHLALKEEKEEESKKYAEEKEELLLKKSQTDVRLQEFDVSWNMMLFIASLEDLFLVFLENH